jgi:hypothetical protein
MLQVFTRGFDRLHVDIFQIDSHQASIEDLCTDTLILRLE